MFVNLFTKACSIVLSVVIVLAPGAAVAQQSDSDFTRAPTGWDSSKLSHSVLADADSAIIQYGRMKQAGQQLTSGDVEVVATSMRIYFDHLQETGFNKALEAKILANQEAFLDYHLSDSDLSTFQKTMATKGFKADATRLRNTLDPDYASRAQFLKMVRTQGLYQTELQMVQQFRTQELQYVSETAPRGSGGKLVSSHHEMRARVVPVISWGFALCLVSAGVGLASGCTLTMPACDAAVIFCGACALAC